MFTVIDAEQRSPAWHAARLGRLTGSRASDMLATLKSGKGEAAGRRNIRVQLALERVTGRPLDSSFLSAAMQQGIDREADALATYEALTGQMLTRTGFLSCDDLMIGCSLDAHVGAFNGLVEAKCPTPAIHLDYLKSDGIPSDYLSQITHNLLVTGAQWADWITFNPDFPEALQSKVIRIQRADVDLKAYELLVRMFLAEVDREAESILALAGAAA